MNALAQLKTGAESAGEPRLAAAFREHLAETEEQERLVSERLSAHDASPSTLKDLAQKGGAMATGALAKSLPDTTGKLAIQAYAFEHLEIASYRMLRVVARQADDAETVQVAEHVLAQEEAAAEKLEGLLEQVASTTSSSWEWPRSSAPKLNDGLRPSRRQTAKPARRRRGAEPAKPRALDRLRRAVQGLSSPARPAELDPCDRRRHLVPRGPMTLLRQPRAIFLALLACAAIGAAPSGASATSPQFHCEIAVDSVCWVHAQSTATVTYRFNSGAVKCSTFTMVSTPLRDFPDHTYNLAVGYTGCVGLGKFAEKTTVAMNGCDYVIRLTPEGKSPWPGTTDVVCGEKQITFTASTGCQVTIGGQVGLEGVKFENGGGTPKDLKATIAIKGVGYSENGVGTCLKSGAQTNGEIEATLTVKAYRDTAPTEEQIPLYIE